MGKRGTPARLSVAFQAVLTVEIGWSGRCGLGKTNGILGAALVLLRIGLGHPCHFGSTFLTSIAILPLSRILPLVLALTSLALVPVPS